MGTYPTRQAKKFREVLLVFSQSDDVLRQLKSDGFQLSENFNNVIQDVIEDDNNESDELVDVIARSKKMRCALK